MLADRSAIFKLPPTQFKTILSQVDIFPIPQLDLNLSTGKSSEQEIKEAFIEFYKLFDDFGIIDKSRYENINSWYEPEHRMKT